MRVVVRFDLLDCSYMALKYFQFGWIMIMIIKLKLLTNARGGQV